MNVKTILQSLCVLGLLAGIGGLYWSNSNLKTELAQAQASNEELKQTVAANEETNAVRAQTASAELARLAKDSDELLRLRNEVRQLRDDKQKLTQQAQAAQTQAQAAQAQVQDLRASAAAAAAAAATPAPPPIQPGQPLTPAMAAAQAQANACLNYLRQIDGAKQQWALEKQKPANAVVTAADIVAYFKENRLPVCPAGGTYTLNGLDAFPTCTIPGHGLPK